MDGGPEYSERWQKKMVMDVANKIEFEGKGVQVNSPGSANCVPWWPVGCKNVLLGYSWLVATITLTVQTVLRSVEY